MEEIIEMARQAGFRYTGNFSVDKGESLSCFQADLEAFTKLMEDKATEEANARANASWTLMCKKMVAIEREALAQHDSVQAKPEPKQENKHIVQSNGRYSPLLTHMMNNQPKTEQEPISFGIRGGMAHDIGIKND